MTVTSDQPNLEYDITSEQEPKPEALADILQGIEKILTPEEQKNLALNIGYSLEDVNGQLARESNSNPDLEKKGKLVALLDRLYPLT